MKIIVNATPLIALAIVEQLDLLHQLFDEVIIPSAVYHEVVTQGGDRPGPQLVKADWLQVMTPVTTSPIEPLLLGLDAGEMEVLLLALQLQPDWVLIDERLARNVAQALGLPVKGTLGVLIAAVQTGRLSKADARTVPERLLKAGIRIGPRLLQWFQAE
jgi:predicted nucleic acid-binding protein